MSTHTTRREFLTRTAALAAGLVLAACAPKAEPTAVPTGESGEKLVVATQPVATAEKITLRHYSWLASINDVMPELYDQLKDVLPNVTFELEETIDKTTCYVAGTCADIVYDIDWRYADKGYCLKLNDYYERDGLDLMRDFYPGLMTVPWKGGIYGVTHLFETCVMMYNVDMVEKYWGKDLWDAFPDGNWDFSDMEEVAKACTVDTDGDGRIDQWGLFLVYNTLYYGMETGTWTRGDDIFDLANVKFNLTSEAARKTAHWLMDSVKGPEGFIISVDDTQEVTQAASVSSPLLAEKCAMHIRMNTDAAAIQRVWGPGDGSKGPRWDMFHLPNDGPRQAVTRAGGKAQTINPTTKYPEECWVAIREMGTSLGCTHAAKHRLYVPGYRADPELRNLMVIGEPKHDNVLYDSMEKKGGYGDHMRFFNWEEVWNNIYQVQNELLYSKSYEEASAELDDFLTRVEKEMNDTVDYGGGEPPFSGITHPFKLS